MDGFGFNIPSIFLNISPNIHQYILNCLRIIDTLHDMSDQNNTIGYTLRISTWLLFRINEEIYSSCNPDEKVIINTFNSIIIDNKDNETLIVYIMRVWKNGNGYCFINDSSFKTNFLQGFIVFLGTIQKPGFQKNLNDMNNDIIHNFDRVLAKIKEIIISWSPTIDKSQLITFIDAISSNFDESSKILTRKPLYYLLMASDYETQKKFIFDFLLLCANILNYKYHINVEENVFILITSLLKNWLTLIIFEGTKPASCYPAIYQIDMCNAGYLYDKIKSDSQYWTMFYANDNTSIDPNGKTISSFTSRGTCTDLNNINIKHINTGHHFSPLYKANDYMQWGSDSKYLRVQLVQTPGTSQLNPGATTNVINNIKYTSNLQKSLNPLFPETEIITAVGDNNIDRVLGKIKETMMFCIQGLNNIINDTTVLPDIDIYIPSMFIFTPLIPLITSGSGSGSKKPAKVKKVSQPVKINRSFKYKNSNLEKFKEKIKVSKGSKGSKGPKGSKGSKITGGADPAATNPTIISIYLDLIEDNYTIDYNCSNIEFLIDTIQNPDANLVAILDYINKMILNPAIWNRESSSFISIIRDKEELILAAKELMKNKIATELNTAAITVDDIIDAIILDAGPDKFLDTEIKSYFCMFYIPLIFSHDPKPITKNDIIELAKQITITDIRIIPDTLWGAKVNVLELKAKIETIKKENQDDLISMINYSDQIYCNYLFKAQHLKKADDIIPITDDIQTKLGEMLNNTITHNGESFTIQTIMFLLFYIIGELYIFKSTNDNIHTCFKTIFQGVSNIKIKHIIGLVIQTIEKIGINYMEKVMADSHQAAEIKKHNAIISLFTLDFWCAMLAIFIGCCIIYYSSLNENKDIQNMGICIFNNAYALEGFNPSKLVDLLKYYNNGTGTGTTTLISMNFDHLQINDTQEIALQDPLSIFKKYLKYKFKYLKKKGNSNSSLKNMIELNKKKLYENINNISYEEIKHKYLKYKNKYLQSKV
jgi:hypothetical protein